MGIASRPIEPHWNYLLAFDADLVGLSRYVEFHQGNFNCFSIEIARILLASAAEVDVVCKLLCKAISPKSRASNILHYRDTIRRAFPRIATFEVFLPRFGLCLRPWSETPSAGRYWSAWGRGRRTASSPSGSARWRGSRSIVKRRAPGC